MAAIGEIMAKYRPRLMGPGIYLGERIPAEKLQNACDSYAAMQSDERPFILKDRTMWGSARKGFLLTDKRF